MCRMLLTSLGGEHAMRVIDIDEFHGLHPEGSGWEGAAQADFARLQPWIMKTIAPKAPVR
jgi:hypothetical protein